MYSEGIERVESSLAAAAADRADVCKPPANEFADMAESAAELERWPHLSAALGHCREMLFDIYRRADRRAVEIQRRHRWVVATAAVCGTVAVLLAVSALTAGRDANTGAAGRWTDRLSPVLVTEVLVAGGALAAVLLGLVVFRQEGWLLERHKAERCRLLKFRFLIDPALWAADDAERVRVNEQLGRDAAEIRELTPQALRKWAEGDRPCELPRLPHAFGRKAEESEAVAQLVGFYEHNRLATQKQYFARGAGRYGLADQLTRYLPATLFFVSVAFALLDVAFEVTGRRETSRVFLVLAVALPVVAAGIRTWRAAHEFGRNMSRFEAKRSALAELTRNLGEAKSPEDTFHLLWQSEQILEADHREWLRLMLEAEWFG